MFGKSHRFDNFLHVCRARLTGHTVRVRGSQQHIRDGYSQVLLDLLCDVLPDLIRNTACIYGDQSGIRISAFENDGSGIEAIEDAVIVLR